MKSRKILIITSILCLVIISIVAINGFYGYYFDDNKENSEVLLDDNSAQNNKKVIENYSETLLDKQSDIINQDYIDNFKETITDIEPIASNINDDDDVISVDTVNEPKIMSSTRIEYQKYYTIDDKLEIEKEVEPPYYMINLTREQIEEFYPEYQLISFSKEKVVLRSIINERSDKYYIIKKHNANIGVFYDYRDTEKVEEIDVEEYLRDIIDIEIKNLVWEEQQKLDKGIIVYGEDELAETLDKLWHLNKFK